MCVCYSLIIIIVNDFFFKILYCNMSIRNSLTFSFNFTIHFMLILLFHNIAAQLFFCLFYLVVCNSLKNEIFFVLITLITGSIFLKTRVMRHPLFLIIFTYTSCSDYPPFYFSLLWWWLYKWWFHLHLILLVV